MKQLVKSFPLASFNKNVILNSLCFVFSDERFVYPNMSKFTVQLFTPSTWEVIPDTRSVTLDLFCPVYNGHEAYAANHELNIEKIIVQFRFYNTFGTHGILYNKFFQISVSSTCESIQGVLNESILFSATSSCTYVAFFCCCYFICSGLRRKKKYLTLF